MIDLPQRRKLPHNVPSWVNEGSLYFITLCAEPRHKNQLCVPGTGSGLLKSAAYYHEAQRWWIRLFLLMPDHVHALLAVPKGESLPTVVRVWKAYQAKTLAIQWQTGFFENRLRSAESEAEKSNYIQMNPVRAGLVAKAEEWQYYWPRG